MFVSISCSYGGRNKSAALVPARSQEWWQRTLPERTMLSTCMPHDETQQRQLAKQDAALNLIAAQ